MKKKIFLSLVLFLFAGSLSAQNWQVQSTPTFQAKFNTIQFFNQNTGWAAGSDGNLFTTTNGGNSWFRKTHSFENEILSLSYIDNESNIWLAGTNGLIANSVSGGIFWNIQNAGTNASLHCVKFITQNAGFVCGDSSIIYRTTNYGTNWNIQNRIPNGDKLFYIKFFSNNVNGIIVGSNSVYATSNSGANWNNINTGTYYFTNAFFTDSLNGWAISSHGVFKSSNTGVTWSTLNPHVTNSNLTSLYFINNLTGYICGTDSTLYKTTNGGANWTELETNRNFSNSNITFKDSVNGFVTTLNNQILKTTTGGLNWDTTAIDSRVYNNPLADICIQDSLTVFAIGNNNTLVKTNNGGVNWNLNYFGGHPLFPAKHGYLIKSMGTDTLIAVIISTTSNQFGQRQTDIMRSVDGGKNWVSTYYAVYPERTVSSVCFVDNQRGFFCESSATGSVKIMRTYNGGLNWSNVDEPSTIDYYNDIFFLDIYKGWLLTRNNANVKKIYRTTTTGIIWQECILTANFNKVRFVNDSVGFICGDAVMKSTNSGANWHMSLNQNNLVDIEFVNQSTGWCISSSGNVWTTTNTGENWFLQVNFPAQSLTALSFKGVNNGWIIGGNGFMAKTTNGGGVFISQTSSEIPGKYLLSQNYPNPFNPSTKINYEIKSSGFVSLKVFDLLGKEVATLVNEKQNAGSYAVDFNSTEFNLPSGIYFYTLNAGEFKETRKMILVK